MPTTIVTDRRAMPLVMVTFPAHEVTDDDVRQFVEEQRALLHSGERYFSVTDASRAVALTARHRKTMGDWLGEAEELSKERVVGQAIVISNPIVRGALTAVFWIRKPAVPTKLFGDVGEAVAHAVEALRAEGFPITGEMRALAARS